MSTKWTQRQLRAICETGGNILVSAAAGSGKTAVLIERILRKIREKTDIDRLLIVTFTSAAAAELRERLYLALQKELESETVTMAQSKRLSRQQTLLSKSYITTIHAFCQNVIKSNSVESGIDASFRIADSGEIAMTRADVMDDVIERWYRKASASFGRLVEIYGSYRSDQGLIDQIFSLYDFAQSSPEPERWLAAQRDAFNPSLIGDFSETKWCADLVRDLWMTAESYRENFLRLKETCEKYGVTEYVAMLEQDIPVAERVAERLREYRNRPATWSALYETICAMQFAKAPVMTAKRKAAYDEETNAVICAVKDARTKLVSRMRDAFFAKMGKSPEAPYEDMALLQEDMACLIDVTLDFSRSYEKRKYDMHILDFNDLEHIAFRTLSVRAEDGTIQRSEVARRYSTYFEEVYIDEYQDTNELQDAILSLVSRDAGENTDANLFLVGDVKQSIYGFRQARPDLFLEKYKTYARKEHADHLVVLRQNFRSRAEVLSSVNRVFHGIMTENTCGIPYEEEEALHFGATYYPENPENHQTELHLVRRSPRNGEAASHEEAEVAADRIKALIDSKYQVYDRSAGCLRDVTYRDIVLLLRAPSSERAGEAYAEALQRRGIPAYYGENGGFFANAEVNILLSFLKIIDNPLQDIHFAAAMRNVYGFPDDALAEIKASSQRRHAEEETFYEMCLKYSGIPSLEERLRQFTDRLDTLRALSRHIPVSELLWMAMHENHFYAHLREGPLRDLHMANINILYARAVLYDNSTNKGLFRFLYYFDSLQRRKGDLSEAAAVTEGMNVVRIMSIHKSKGLEFPVVVLSETGKAFNKRDVSAPLLKHRTLGLGPTCYLEAQRVKYPSVMKFCVARRLEADNKAEEMRVLYVAMTRAAEKLILTGCIRTEFDKYREICKNKCSSVTGMPLEYHVLDASCFLDWLMMSGAAEPAQIYLHDLSEAEASSADEIRLRQSLPIPQPQMTFYKEEYRGDTATAPAKISVSDLKRTMDRYETDEASRAAAYTVKLAELPDFAYEGPSDLTAAERGTAVHTCLQLTDYARIRGMDEAAAADYAEEVLLLAQDRCFLDQTAADSVNRKLLVRYFTGALAQRIAAADGVWKELPFTQLMELGGSATAVQGMIDCLIREGDRYTVIDFKTDDRPDAAPYKVQLRCYAECVRKAFGAEPEQIVYFIKQNKEVHL